MTQDFSGPERGELLSEETELTMVEFCRTCSTSTSRVVELVQEGVITPRGTGVEDWRFNLHELHRVNRALRLQRDLGLNLAGVALALDLLDQIDTLTARLERP